MCTVVVFSCGTLATIGILYGCEVRRLSLQQHIPFPGLRGYIVPWYLQSLYLTYKKISQGGWAHSPALFLKMQTTTLVCLSTGTVPVLHTTLKRCVTQDSPTVTQSLQHLRANLIHIWHLATKELSNYHGALNQRYKWGFTQIFRLCLLHRECIVWLQEVLKVLFPLLNNISSPGQQFSTLVWAKPCFPFLSHQTICQNLSVYVYKKLNKEKRGYNSAWGKLDQGIESGDASQTHFCE